MKLTRSRVGVAVTAILVAAALGVYVGASSAASGYTVHSLVSDGGVAAPVRDAVLVNGWGLAATPTGPWWTTNEASGTSALYSGDGHKQALTVSVPGGPTGITTYSGFHGFLVSAAGKSDPARFIYACEDGRIRAWTPTVPTGWSTESEVVVDDAGEAAIFRGVAVAGGRLYATDFHNGRIDVFDSRWHQTRVSGSFNDPSVPAWYAPDNIQAFGGHLFVTYVGRAPVNGNDDPTGGYVDEFDLQGHLVAPVARMGVLNEPWGLALAPSTFGRYSGDLLVANFGDGHVNAFRKTNGRWTFDGALAGGNGKPIVLNGVWGIAFGNGGLAGAKDELFFASGPHLWRGPTELATHGLFGSISAS
jgi:uncharacterized protein (TIGR03118 family)